MKSRPNASAKSIDPGQPAQSAQSDLGRNFLLLNSNLIKKILHKALIFDMKDIWAMNNVIYIYMQNKTFSS